MRREEESAMAPIDQNEVERGLSQRQVVQELGMIIVQKNPARKLMQPVPPQGGTAETFQEPAYGHRQRKFTAWPRKLQSALTDRDEVMEFKPDIETPDNYQVEGVYEIDYVNAGDAPNKVHRLWIIYGSGGK
jgi:hypothetical protein